MDYRAERMEECIRNAFLSCVKEKDFNNITVRDITQEAKINRSTFYRYYEDKYQLRDTIIDEAVNDFTTHMAVDWLDMNISRDMTFSEQLISCLKYLEKKRSLFLTLWSSNHLGQDVYEKMIKAGAAIMTKIIYEHPLVSDERRTMAEWYGRLLTNNLLVTLRWWFEAASDMPAEELARHMLAHMKNGTIPTLKTR